MNERLLELRSVLSSVRRRWTERAVFRAWTLGALAAAVVLLAGYGAVLAVAREGASLIFATAVTAAAALFALIQAFWPLRRRPTDRQIARYVEERAPGLDDVLVTAVDYADAPGASPEIREYLAADAVRAARGVPLDEIVSSRSIRVWALRAIGAGAALILAVALLMPAFKKATGLAAAYLFPARIAVEVTPGTTKLRAGRPVTITARVHGVEGGVTPTLTLSAGDSSRSVRMDPGAEPGTFQATLENVTQSFDYHVAAITARSDTYTISVIRPPRVERIDLRYEFPKELGLEPRVEEDSGDIYGPAGTRVQLTIVTDKPIARGSLKLDDGTAVELGTNEQTLNGQLTIEDDGSYRIALADVDGLENDGDTEYFIRTLADRPPDVRILRPASDKKVTPLEEVDIEARADDDYGIASFDLVFQAPGGKERVVPFRGPKGGLTAEGLHTLFLEDLGVQPGDFVTYFARARDVSRGRRSVEARSDIFFLEVKPFEEEFVAATSQAMAGMGANNADLQQLIEAQKQIIVATWKLDARVRRARNARPARDIRDIAYAQSELKNRAEEIGGRISRTLGDPRRRRGLGGPAPSGNDPMGKAIEAMGRASVELEKLETSSALPHEMEALNQLLKAQAENKRRQVARAQQAGGGGGMNRSEADLSSLFDQELRRRNQTNYETPTTTESRQENKPDDTLERLRELARRQDALMRQQRDLARNREQIEEEELKRQLERLTREQNQLRQEADRLSREMAQRGGQQNQRSSGQRASGQSSSGSSGQSGQSQGSRQLREIAEEMRNAASDLQRQNPDQASARSARASERLRELERQLQSAQPDDRRRALGDLQLESRQLADAQRRLANEASKVGEGRGGEDARRRLAGEQERLAERAERLQESVKQLAKSGQGDAEERRATEDAARELERQRLNERMRKTAESLRNNGEASQGDEIARALDQVADRLGAASGAKDADSRRLSERLATWRGCSARIRREAVEAASRGTASSRAQPAGRARRGSAGSRDSRRNPARVDRVVKAHSPPDRRAAAKGLPMRAKAPAASRAATACSSCSGMSTSGCERRTASPTRSCARTPAWTARRRPKTGGAAFRLPAPKPSSRTSPAGSRSRRTCSSRWRRLRRTSPASSAPRKARNG
jgi:hypothetical protein